MTTTHIITVNAGKTNERTEVVHPLKVSGTNTLVSFVRGSSVATRWIATKRIQVRD